MKISEYLKQVYNYIDDRTLEDQGLLTIDSKAVLTPLVKNIYDLFEYRVKSKDEYIQLDIVEELIRDFKVGFQRINHFGLCYKVNSKKEEVDRLSQLVSDTKFHLYQEPSSDDGDWIFYGDISNINNSLIEFIPHEGKSEDKWINYWLPHIHLDIDTNFKPDEIKGISQKHINNVHIPYSININRITYIQRIRLGCIEGINLFLDVSTCNRDNKYRNSWTKLI